MIQKTENTTARFKAKHAWSGQYIVVVEHTAYHSMQITIHNANFHFFVQIHKMYYLFIFPFDFHWLLQMYILYLVNVLD